LFDTGWKKRRITRPASDEWGKPGNIPAADSIPAPPPAVHTATSILMRAPREHIFETAANLENWPRILPHYRYIRYLERGTIAANGAVERNVVVMAASRDGIPISWTSEQIVDRARQEVRFTHLKALTKGMHVVWTFTDTPDGVRVEILHDLRFRFPPLAPLADRIIGGFFIDNIANKTLRCMKAHLEAENPKSEIRNPKNSEPES
jgi:aromatase